jgi:subtilisin-like proprotein convertase family protein
MQSAPAVKTVAQQGLTKAQVKAEMNKLAAEARAAEMQISDNPAINAGNGKLAAFSGTPTTNAACLFPGSLGAGDLTMGLRLFRPGAPGGTCAAPQPFPGTAGAGPYYYDAYTFTNTTGSAACVVVNLTTTDLTNANIQSAAYLGSFNPGNLATNYLADPYVSSGTPAAPAGLTYSFNLANGATTVIIVFSANPNGTPAGTASNYTLSIDGLASACTPPPPCTPPTSSVLSQVGGTTTCTGSTANLKVDITGGNYPTYSVTINAVPGGNFTVNNYVSGSYIPVTPAVTTSYSLVSVVATGNPSCIGSGNSGNPTITVLPTTVTPITIVDDPAGPICAGDPKLLTVTGAPGVQTFSNTSPITINTSGPANPYPSNLVVSGLPVSGSSVKSVTITGLNHTWSSDVDILLQSPTNQNVVLLSDIGTSGDFVNHTYTFDDAAPTTMPSTSPPPASGTYKPTNIGAADTWVAPGPGAINQAAPALSTFTGDMNGTWKLFVVDDLGGDGGSITGGYSITFATPAAPPPTGWTFVWTPAAGLSSTTGNPVAASPMNTTTYTVVGTAPNGCQTSAAITVVVNQRPAVVTNPRDTTVCAGGTATFSVTGSGAGLTYQWQLSTTGAGGPWANIANGGVYSGATTNTLTITGATAAMSGYRYRAVLNGTCAPAVNSTGAVLTVNALPVVTISPSGQVCGGVAGTIGTALTASGANSYTWSPVTGLYTNAAATIPYTGGNAATVYAAPAVNTVYTVTGTSTATGCSNTATISVVYTPAAPTVSPASVTKCLPDAPVQLCITSSLAPSPFTASYSSGPISVAIPEGAFPAPPATAAVSTIAVPLPATAQITNMRVTMNITHPYVGDVVAVLKAPNGQVFNLDALLNRTNNPGANFVNTVIASNGTTTLDLGVAPFTGTFRADAAGATFTAFGFTLAGGPVGYTPTTTSWNSLYPSPNGNWTLAMYDAGAPDLGTLTSWSIAFDYLYGPPAAGIWTPAAGLFTDAAGTIPYVAGTPATCVYANPTPSGVYPYQVTVQSVGPDAFQTFTNPAPVTINSSGSSPYPSNLAVSGLPTTGVSVQSVMLNNLSHTWSDDIDVVLQSPTGQNVILMSDVGGSAALNNVTYTFVDGAAAMGTAANPTGTYRPTNLVGTIGVEPDNFPAPGPGPVTQTAPALSTFTGDANGTWKLFIVDDAAGDVGTLAGGYSIRFRWATPGCTSPARTVNVTVNQPAAVTAQPVNQTICTDKVATFSVTATGTAPLGYQWQVSTDGGNTYTNVTNGGVYSGATTSTLNITAPPVSMSGYFYRVIVQGATPCPSITSFQRTLTVNPLPTVVISANPYTRLFPGLSTTISSTVSPAAASSYTWLRNGVVVPGAFTGTLNVDIDGLGDYRLRVTDINGCTNVSNTITISDSVNGKCFIYPNPTSGQFQVRYYSAANNVLPRTLTVYDSKGDRVFTKSYVVGRPYDRMDVDMRAYGKGLYWVEIGDLNGSRLSMCRVVIQ